MRPWILAWVVSLLLLPSIAHAGAWTKAQWHFYLQVGTSFSFANTRYNSNGETAPIVVRKSTMPGNRELNMSNYQQLLSDLYFEVGLLDRLTIFGDIPIMSARQLNPGGDINYSVNGFGDILAGLRAGLLVDPFAVALEVRLGFPSGDARAVIPTGSGDFRGELRLALGKAFQRVPIYWNLEFGFMLRGTGEVNDATAASGKALARYAPELAIHAEIGGALVRWQQANRLMLTLAVDYRGSTTRSDALDPVLSLVPENSEFTTISPSLIWYAYHGFGVLVRFTQALQGRRLPSTSTVAASLFVNY